MSYRKTAIASSLSLLPLAAVHAHAGTSGSIALTSDYLFRGITQTNEEPALQGGIEYAHDGGFYAATWGSSISWLSDADPDVSSQVEIDGYAGYRGSFGGSGIGFDVGALYYWYPGDYPPGFTDPDTAEIYAGLGCGPFTAKYSRAITDLFGLPCSDASGALDLAANWEFAPSWMRNAAVGRQWVRGYDGADYACWKLGPGKSFDNGFVLAAAWNDNDLIGADETVAFTVTRGPGP